MNRSKNTMRLWRMTRALCCVCFALFLCCVSARAASGISFQDYFTNREVSTASSDRVDGSNVGATREPNEPNHGGKPGAHSIWISWVAPTNGVATFWTDGSAIDTLLSAYSLPIGETTIDKLLE